MGNGNYNFADPNVTYAAPVIDIDKLNQDLRNNPPVAEQPISAAPYIGTTDMTQIGVELEKTYAQYNVIGVETAERIVHCGYSNVMFVDDYTIGTNGVTSNKGFFGLMYPVTKIKLDADICAKLSAKALLNGAKIKLSYGATDPTNSGLIQWIRIDSDGYLKYANNNFHQGTEFTAKIEDNSILLSSNGSPIYIDINDDESMKYGLSSAFQSGTNKFQFSADASGQGELNLNISFQEFLNQMHCFKHAATGRPLCAWNSWRSWDKPCVGTAPRMHLFVVEPGPLYKRYAERYLNDKFKADCVMGKSDDGEVCQLLNLNADAFMDNYCDINPMDPYCGCYPKAVDAEAEKLSEDLAPYKDILKAQPRCWAKGCASGYIPKSLRDMNQCNITICKQEISVNGDENILRDVEGRMLCQGGTPLTKPNPISSDHDSSAKIDDPVVNKPPPETEPNTAENLNIIYILLLIVAIIFVVFSIIKLRQRKNYNIVTYNNA